MSWTRREWLAAAGASVLAQSARVGQAAAPGRHMGVVIDSYSIRRAADKERSFKDALVFLDYCQTLGAGGVQTALGVRDDASAEMLRNFAETHQLDLEGSIALPRDKADVSRFTAEVRTAKRSGALVFRTVLMNGRRYEVFTSAEAFRNSFEQAKQSLHLARPVVESHEVRMAVENHKDLQSPDLLELIKELDSPYIGICVDTGNSIALLEMPMKTVELLAPLAFTTHIKDMGVEDYADGFLLAEVPLGTGFLDLPAIVTVLRRARPEIRLNLEMITRDPLKIPCLTPKYWATLESVSGKRLAELLAFARAQAAKSPLPRLSTLSKEEQLNREDENVRECLKYARERLDN
jgi:sugar phosphate isomerase/epimerase